MDDTGAPEPGFSSPSMEWTVIVPLVGVSKADSLRGEGIAIGAALTYAVLFGFVAWFFNRQFGGFAVFVGAGVAIAVGVWWLVRLRPRPAYEMVESWPVRFVLHELGAEAIAEGDPPPEVATALYVQLSAQATSRSLRSGLGSGIASGLLAFSRSKRGPDEFGPVAVARRVDWNRVIAISLDERAQIIDLAGVESAGVRLRCTPDTFAAASSFIWRHAHRVNFDLPQPGTTGTA